MTKNTASSTSGSGNVPGARGSATEIDSGANVTIAYFEEGIPPFVEAEMERLYENLFSSVPMVRAYGGTAGVSTYVARKSGQPIAIFLLRTDKSKLVVLNEQISVSAEEIERFTRYVFARFKSVGMIRFNAVDAHIDGFALPYLQARFTNDIVLALPADAAQYLSSLGKSTRQNIRHYLARIRRDYPTFRHTAFENGDEGEYIFADIVRLNRARMSEKDKVCGVDDDEAARLLALAQRCGMVSVVTINGRVCAGAICYRVGANYFLRVLAHDSGFNAYGLGLLCCYLTICECIARGGKEFHFMWGREEYKYRLLGQQRDFDSLVIYRSRLRLLLDGRSVAATRLGEWRERLKYWLLAPENQTRVPVRHARAALEAARRFARARRRKR